MSDEDAPTFEPPRAAIPSRAISGTVPHATMPPVNALPPVQEPAPRTRRKRKTQKLPVREIKRITTNRRKALAKKAAKRVVKTAPAKNPNRPLELKTRMGAVLTAVSAMSKAEAAVFTAVMQHMEDMSRSGRRHVISALGQVYG